MLLNGAQQCQKLTYTSNFVVLHMIICIMNPFNTDSLCIDALISILTVTGWVQKRLIKLYIDCCKELSETPNMKLLKRLCDLMVSNEVKLWLSVWQNNILHLCTKNCLWILAFLPWILEYIGLFNFFYFYYFYLGHFSRFQMMKLLCLNVTCKIYQ